MCGSTGAYDALCQGERCGMAEDDNGTGNFNTAVCGNWKQGQFS